MVPIFKTTIFVQQIRQRMFDEDFALTQKRNAKPFKKRGLRHYAAEIGISSATLSRLLNRKLPDIETFGLVIKWLGYSADDFFYYKKPKLMSRLDTISTTGSEEGNSHD